MGEEHLGASGATLASRSEPATMDSLDVPRFLALNPDIARFAAGGGDPVAHFARHGQSEQRRQLRSPVADMVAPRGYDVIYSIGSECLTSMALKRSGLKRESGPFDWIFSSIGMVADCLTDGFAAFLDPANYRPIPPEQRETPTTSFCDHAIFRDRYDISSIFNHADPTTPETHAYLERSATRLTGSIDGDRETLLLGIVQPHRFQPGDFDRLCAVVADHPTVEVTVLLQRRQIGAAVALEPLWTDGRHRLFELRHHSLNKGTEFDDQVENEALLAEVTKLFTLQ